MSLLAPLGLVFAVTLPLTVLLYLLRVRRMGQAVSSLFLWQAMPRDLAAQEPLQRLRPNVLLFLQLALLALLTLALARPALTVLSPPPIHHVLLLDASASMQAIDPGESLSRFERARQAARRTIEAAPANSRFSVVEARAHPQLLLSRQAGAERALEAIGAARVSGSAANMSEALLLARSLSSDGLTRRISVFTDQAFSLGEGQQEQLGPGVEVVPSGGDASNLAVTTIAARRSPTAPDAQDIFVRVEAFADRPAQAMIELRLAGQARDQRTVDVRPGAPAELVFEAVPTSAGAAEVAVVAADDGLAVDDVGYLALQARRPSQILLVSNGDARLERALTLVRGAEVFRVAPRRYLATDVDRFDVVVFDREVPPVLPQGNVLILGPSGTAPFLPPGPPQVLRQPQALAWDRDDPLLAYTDLRGLTIRRAHVLAPPPWARTLLQGDNAALMFAGRDPGGRRVVTLGFAPVESNLALLPAFPILVNNVMEWLAPPALVSQHQVSTGRATDLLPLPSASELLVSTPQRQSAAVVIPVPGDGAPVSFGATDQPGLYQVQQRAQDGALLDQAVERFAVNLADAAESDVRARPDSVASSELAALGEVALPRELWPWALLLALPLLALEGWWFHRR